MSTDRLLDFAIDNNNDQAQTIESTSVFVGMTGNGIFRERCPSKKIPRQCGICLFTIESRRYQYATEIIRTSGIRKQVS